MPRPTKKQINLTKESDKIWRNWGLLIRAELKLHYYKKTNQKLQYFIYKLLAFTAPIIL